MGGGYNQMLERILLSVLVIILMANLVVAQPIYKQNENVELNIPCTINGAICSNSAYCQFSIINPLGVTLINGENMTQNVSIFTYPLNSNQTTEIGQYEFPVTCCDAGACGTRHLTFLITPTGETPTTAKGLMLVGLLGGLFILFIAGVVGGSRAKHIALKCGLFLGAYLCLIGVIFISWNLSLSYLTTTPFLISFLRIVFYILLFGFFPSMLLLTIYTLYMMFKIKEIEDMVDRGIPLDEAYERQVRSGVRGWRNW